MKGRRVLFVCGGNTCRSPLAAALAARYLPGVAADSAGVAPGYAIAAHTVALAEELVGADLSEYPPRAVHDVDVHSYEIVVALDSMVANALAGDLSPLQRLVTWEIKDPYGGTLEDYRRTAEEIIERLSDLAE